MKRRLLIAALLLIFSGAAAPPAPGRADALPPHPVYVPLLARSAGPPAMPLIAALVYDGYLAGEPDECFQVYNPSDDVLDLTGWQALTATRAATFPTGMQLKPHESAWCSRSAAAFRRAWGFSPQCEWGEDTDPQAPDMTGSNLQFSNTGGRLSLRDPKGVVRDVLVYKGGEAPGQGWTGLGVAPYRPTTTFSEAGQVLYRKLDPLTARPLGDTDRATDWAQDPADRALGARARYPGWSIERFFRPARATEDASLQIIVAPDHSLTALSGLLRSAAVSIEYEGYTFESAEIVAELEAARQRGVTVTLLLEGTPPGGVTDEQRWCVQRVEAAGGRVHYLRESDDGVRPRYLYQHAKSWLLDRRTAVVGTENPSPESLPADDKADGALGRRGVLLVTDAPSVVERLAAILDDDLDPAHHADLWRWQPEDPKLGAPPEGYAPPPAPELSGYPIRFPRPFTTRGRLTVEVLQAPEGGFRADEGLLGLLARAGQGDTVLVEQLYEQTWFGPASGSVKDTPNPRLEAYVAAARRGATVRVLLDSYFDADNLDDPRCNLRTVEYLNATAQAEGLDLQARRGNPTGQGLHNKMVLAQIDGRGWITAGSLNGGETSARLNREIALIVETEDGYRYLADVFASDWAASEGRDGS